MEVPKYKLNSSKRSISSKISKKGMQWMWGQRPINENEAREFNIPLNTQVMYANKLNSEEKAIKKRRVIMYQMQWFWI